MIIFEVIVKVSFVILGSILHNSGLNLTKKTAIMCDDFEIRKVNYSGIWIKNLYCVHSIQVVQTCPIIEWFIIQVMAWTIN